MYISEHIIFISYFFIYFAVTLVGIPEGDFFGDYEGRQSRDTDVSSDESNPLFPDTGFPSSFGIHGDGHPDSYYPSFSDIMRHMQGNIYPLLLL